MHATHEHGYHSSPSLNYELGKNIGPNPKLRPFFRDSLYWTTNPEEHLPLHVAGRGIISSEKTPAGSVATSQDRSWAHWTPNELLAFAILTQLLPSTYILYDQTTSQLWQTQWLCNGLYTILARISLAASGSKMGTAPSPSVGRGVDQTWNSSSLSSSSSLLEIADSGLSVCFFGWCLSWQKLLEKNHAVSQNSIRNGAGCNHESTKTG